MRAVNLQVKSFPLNPNSWEVLAIGRVISGRTTWHVMGMGRNSRTQCEPTTLRDRKREDPKEKTEYRNDEKDDYDPALIRGKNIFLEERFHPVIKEEAH
ncbi:hypothetical protein CEXT_243441 [Caerostris extrusa]|uniref:Uncharacterized protein n=1 Tax=Caerostris extrusa TaxID=172846 RepID=A0AAV4ST95_CAEEX|nr:hypothetical protein CEXT_243441 [Caerostris extrusa]